jgi:hypothetical protein
MFYGIKKLYLKSRNAPGLAPLNKEQNLYIFSFLIVRLVHCGRNCGGKGILLIVM